MRVIIAFGARSEHVELSGLVGATAMSRGGTGRREDQDGDVLLIFDGDCGFCTTSAGWIERRLPDDVRVAPWQILDLDDYGLTEADVTTAAYWVDDEGVAHRGHVGIGKSLIAAGGVWTAPGHLIVRPPVGWIAKPLYAWIAKNRHRMPGASEACRVDLSAPAGEPGAPSRD